jgi:hypothetical protein
MVDWRNGLSHGSFPQIDVSMPRPSRLSGSYLKKIAVNNEMPHLNRLKRQSHRRWPVWLIEAPLL